MAAGLHRPAEGEANVEVAAMPETVTMPPAQCQGRYAHV
jgi:hypothetical protein